MIVTFTICYVTLSYENGDRKNNPTEICSFEIPFSHENARLHYRQHPVMQQIYAAGAIPLCSTTAVCWGDAGRASKAARRKLSAESLYTLVLQRQGATPFENPRALTQSISGALHYCCNGHLMS